MADIFAFMYKLFMHNFMNDKLIDAVKVAMLERGVRQQELARQCSLSQGHLSKVLKFLPMGTRTRNRLQKWVDSPAGGQREGLLDAEELLRLGKLLKSHCEALASVSPRVVQVESTNGGAGS